MFITRFSPFNLSVSHLSLPTPCLFLFLSPTFFSSFHFGSFSSSLALVSSLLSTLSLHSSLIFHFLTHCFTPFSLTSVTLSYPTLSSYFLLFHTPTHPILPPFSSVSFSLLPSFLFPFFSISPMPFHLPHCFFSHFHLSFPSASLQNVTLSPTLSPVHFLPHLSCLSISSFSLSPSFKFLLLFHLSPYAFLFPSSLFLYSSSFQIFHFLLLSSPTFYVLFLSVTTPFSCNFHVSFFLSLSSTGIPPFLLSPVLFFHSLTHCLFSLLIPLSSLSFHCSLLLPSFQLLLSSLHSFIPHTFPTHFLSPTSTIFSPTVFISHLSYPLLLFLSPLPPLPKIVYTLFIRLPIFHLVFIALTKQSNIIISRQL